MRAFNPSPGATVQVGDTVIKCWQTLPLAAASSLPHPPGTVLADAGGIIIACGDGSALQVTELQKPGGRRQPAQQFLQAMPLPPGTRCAVPGNGAAQA
ncbi:Methionyl-tRNA formyltransferase [compost metagenome]